MKQTEKLYDGEKYQEAIDLLLDKPSKKGYTKSVLLAYSWFLLFS